MSITFLSPSRLIAIMLGRLQMTIPECIDTYTNLASQIFGANAIEKALNFANTGAYYGKDGLEKAVKALVKKRTGDENAPMLDPDTTNQCKVCVYPSLVMLPVCTVYLTNISSHSFVVSGQSKNLSHASAEQFRTYATSFPDKFAGCAIWEAARATSAAPTYLPSITINGTDFVDGGLRFNNPSILWVVILLLCEKLANHFSFQAFGRDQCRLWYCSTYWLFLNHRDWHATQYRD